jgi:RNA polymerase sigma-70 factor (ECF subfamily)
MPMDPDGIQEQPMGYEKRGLDPPRTFEQVVLPHMDAAYNLARWLVRNTEDAEDIVQEAYLRAFKFFGGYQGGDSRSWILKIVRNASYSFIKKNRSAEPAEEFDEKIHRPSVEPSGAEEALLQSADSRMLRDALDELPANFREVLVLREIEGMTYKEIAELTEMPIGTVMSSLARGRAQLRDRLLRAGKAPARNAISVAQTRVEINEPNRITNVPSLIA